MLFLDQICVKLRYTILGLIELGVNSENLTLQFKLDGLGILISFSNLIFQLVSLRLHIYNLLLPTPSRCQLGIVAVMVVEESWGGFWYTFNADVPCETVFDVNCILRFRELGSDLDQLLPLSIVRGMCYF